MQVYHKLLSTPGARYRDLGPGYHKQQRAAALTALHCLGAGQSAPRPPAVEGSGLPPCHPGRKRRAPEDAVTARHQPVGRQRAGKVQAVAAPSRKSASTQNSIAPRRICASSLGALPGTMQYKIPDACPCAELFRGILSRAVSLRERAAARPGPQRRAESKKSTITDTAERSRFARTKIPAKLHRPHLAVRLHRNAPFAGQAYGHPRRAHQAAPDHARPPPNDA